MASNTASEQITPVFFKFLTSPSFDDELQGQKDMADVLAVGARRGVKFW
jgi:hypothetical protein